MTSASNQATFVDRMQRPFPSNKFDSSVKTRMFHETGVENRYDQSAKPNHPSFQGGVAFKTGWGLQNDAFTK